MTRTMTKTAPTLLTLVTAQEEKQAPAYMEKLATKYRELEADIKALEAKQATLKAEMIAELEADNADEAAAGVFTVRYKLIKSRVFNTTEFKSAEPDTYEQYLQEKTTHRFTVA